MLLLLLATDEIRYLNRRPPEREHRVRHGCLEIIEVVIEFSQNARQKNSVRPQPTEQQTVASSPLGKAK